MVDLAVLVISLFTGILLVRDLFLYSKQLPLFLTLLYPLPLIFTVVSIVLWTIRRKPR